MKTYQIWVAAGSRGAALAEIHEWLGPRCDARYLEHHASYGLEYVYRVTTSADALAPWVASRGSLLHYAEVGART